MFREIIFLTVVGMITCLDFYFPFDERENIDFDVDNGIEFITIQTNKDNQISHPEKDYEHLKFVKKVDGTIHYSIGARSSSDRLVAQGGQNQSFASPHNVALQLTYPQSGYGATVTYVAVVVEQTSSLGKAYVVKGGVGQQMISIVVEGYNTLVFNVSAFVYGY